MKAEQEKLCAAVTARWRLDRLPFLTALAVGLLAHGYAFANKLVNHDEIESLFGKGATITSGRWGLELVKILFPDWSMPWIYGLLSLVMMAAAICLMLDYLELKSPALRLLSAAIVISFPTMTGIFCFMFTSSAYAWAFLLAVLSVAVLRRGSKGRLARGLVLLVLALGIYQAFIAVTAALFLLRMLRDAMDAERPVRDIVLDGVRALAFMAAAIAVYCAVTLLVFRFTGAAFNSYVTENVNGSVGLLRRVRMAYDAFFYVFSFRNFYLVPTEFSRYLHIVLGCLLLLGLGALAARKKSPLHAALLLVLTLLLPLCICCMYLIMSQQSIHTLVLYSFTALYLLAALVIERLSGRAGRAAGTLLSLMLAIVTAVNVGFANMTYLKLQLQYENAYAFYTALSAQIVQTEGFDGDCRLAFVGYQDNLLHRFPELDTALLQGPSPDLVNIYSRENFLRYYLGFDIPFASEEETERLAEDPRVLAMAEYPYYGSVRKIDDFIVVRLG